MAYVCDAPETGIPQPGVRGAILAQGSKPSRTLWNCIAKVGLTLGIALLAVLVLRLGHGTSIKSLLRTYGPMILIASALAGLWGIRQRWTDGLKGVATAWVGIMVFLQMGQFIVQDQWPFVRQTVSTWVHAGFSHEALRRQDPAYQFVLFCQEHIPQGASYALLADEPSLHTIGHMLEYFLYPRWFYHIEPEHTPQAFWTFLKVHGIRYVAVVHRSDVPPIHPIFSATGVRELRFDAERYLYILPEQIPLSQGSS